MFRHHKYCVIEVSGQLMADAQNGGETSLYLLDAQSDSEGDSQRIAIADADFSAFVEQHTALLTSASPVSPTHARITATVDLDAKHATLLGITRAVLHTAAQGLVTYEPSACS